MAEARRSDAWDHTAMMLAQNAEIHRDTKRRKSAFTPGEFHPFVDTPTPRRTGGIPINKHTMPVLKTFFSRHANQRRRRRDTPTT